jgi:hypothetical protein
MSSQSGEESSQKQEMKFALEEIDDGHKPGKTSLPTLLAVNNKSVSKFMSIFDDLLSPQWLARTYEYACAHNKPWGELFASLTTFIAEKIFRCLHYNRRCVGFVLRSRGPVGC